MLTDEQIDLMLSNDDPLDWMDMRFQFTWRDGYATGARAVESAVRAEYEPVVRQMLDAMTDFSEYVHTEQCGTDGAVIYSTTQINRLVFKARSAITAAKALLGEK